MSIGVSPLGLPAPLVFPADKQVANQTNSLFEVRRVAAQSDQRSLFPTDIVTATGVFFNLCNLPREVPLIIRHPVSDTNRVLTPGFWTETGY